MRSVAVQRRKTILGSQLPEDRQLTPARPVPNGRIGGPLPPESRDPEWLEEASMDMHYDREIMPARRDWEDGIPLADFECRHGFLPSDTNINCNCWRSHDQVERNVA